jgi:hypothetical protein
LQDFLSIFSLTCKHESPPALPLHLVSKQNLTTTLENPAKQLQATDPHQQLVPACTTNTQTFTKPEPNNQPSAQTPRRCCARRVSHNNTQRKNTHNPSSHQKATYRKLCPVAEQKNPLQPITMVIKLITTKPTYLLGDREC